MNISVNWLKEYLHVNVPVEELARILTSIGLEVGGYEAVQSIKGGLQGLFIGEVLTCEKHENSDHLHVTTVSTGAGDPLQIVCGAPNVAAGQKVVVATIGAKLYTSAGEEFVIKRSKIRGVESFGMLCAEDEIGIGTDHNGIIVLPENTKTGMPASEYYQVENDVVIEVDITPNRVDAASHFGVARDLAAYFASRNEELKLIKPSVENFKIDNRNFVVDVTVENSEACPRYCGVTLSGITVKESPSWLKNRLSAIGIRPINNVVDATNYVLHALGQPLHAFDGDQLQGNRIVVKNLPSGTKFVTLDGVERSLREEDLMICNAEQGMCIGGVFGGADSGITESTTKIFLESAYFHPVSIRKTARAHGLNTDASFRFERGCDPNNTLYVLKYAALLIQEVAGGVVSSDVADIYPNPVAPCQVELSYEKTDALIGKSIERSVIKKIVKGLEMDLLHENESGLTLSIPTYRVDVLRDVDVIEDILRIYGYNQIEVGTTVKSSLSYSANPDSWKIQNLISEQLTANGFREIMNNSFTKPSYYSTLKSFPADACVKIMNPLGVDLSVMRQTLLFGGLETVLYNRNRKFTDLKLYEFGNCYYFQPEQQKQGDALSAYNEDFHLGMWLSGNKTSQNWVKQEEKSSYFELKAHVQNLLVRTGINLLTIAEEDFSDELFEEAVRISSSDGVLLVTMGSLSSKLLKQMDIDADVFYADVNWKNLMKAIESHQILYTEIPKTPEVRRDLALLLDKHITFAEIRKIAYETERTLLKKVDLFDVYEGKNLPAGKKSYAVSFFLQDTEKTLKDSQIDAFMQKLIKNLTLQLGAVLR